jgi:K+-sensing histidine kinase KdpD
VNTAKDRILIVENDPVISDFIGRQALSSAGYQVFTVGEASSAISKTLQIAPDLIITDINLPGLNGKDLMVALSSQGIDIPIIVIAQKGKEAEVIQTFRLGAADYFTWPLKEPEIIQAVERILKQVHERRERTQLERKLKETNQQLQQRVRELTAIFSMGKAVTSITDQRVLFDKIIQVATQVSLADLGWFLMREEEKEKTFILVAHHNLPDSMQDHLQQAWDDGISSLVAMSGETLSMHGEPIKRFRVKSMGQSILIVPIKVQRQVMGILVLMRKQPQPFNESEQHLLEAVADYASISLVNARLFRAIEARAHALENLANHTQYSERVTHELLKAVENQFRRVNANGQTALDELTKDPTAKWNPTQRKSLTVIQENLQTAVNITNTITPAALSSGSSHGQITDLTNLVKDISSRFLPLVQQHRLQLAVELSSSPIVLDLDSGHIREILQGLLTNAIQYCQAQGIIRMQASLQSNHLALLMVSNSGNISQSIRDQIFRKPSLQNGDLKKRFGGIGISLELIREIVQFYNGKIWVDQHPEFGTTFHVLLPLSKSEH